MRHFNIIPKTFVLPKEYTDFCCEFISLLSIPNTLSGHSIPLHPFLLFLVANFRQKQGTWIVKPVASSRGRGISIITHVSLQVTGLALPELVETFSCPSLQVFPPWLSLHPPSPVSWLEMSLWWSRDTWTIPALLMVRIQLPSPLSWLFTLAADFLCSGFKFDLRLYVAVTSFEPLRVYLYEEGLARFASVQYSQGGEELDNHWMHLTNYSVNRKNVDYVR